MSRRRDSLAATACEQPAEAGLHDPRRCARLAGLFKTLSHPKRLLIFCWLCDGERAVFEMQRVCDVSQSVISQHLTRMRLEGIVSSRRSGNRVLYRLADPALPALIRSMEKIVNG